jgi:hypothetical protein
MPKKENPNFTLQRQKVSGPQNMQAKAAMPAWRSPAQERGVVSEDGPG